jgi:hypothetical protein
MEEELKTLAQNKPGLSFNEFHDWLVFESEQAESWFQAAKIYKYVAPYAFDQVFKPYWEEYLKMQKR